MAVELSSRNWPAFRAIECPPHGHPERQRWDDLEGWGRLLGAEPTAFLAARQGRTVGEFLTHLLTLSTWRARCHSKYMLNRDKIAARIEMEKLAWLDEAAQTLRLLEDAWKGSSDWPDRDWAAFLRRRLPKWGYREELGANGLPVPLTPPRAMNLAPIDPFPDEVEEIRHYKAQAAHANRMTKINRAEEALAASRLETIAEQRVAIAAGATPHGSRAGATLAPVPSQPQRSRHGRRKASEATRAQYEELGKKYGLVAMAEAFRRKGLSLEDTEKALIELTGVQHGKPIEATLQSPARQQAPTQPRRSLPNGMTPADYACIATKLMAQADALRAAGAPEEEVERKLRLARACFTPWPRQVEEISNG